MRLRVWSEFLSYDELQAPAVLDLLARYEVGMCVQVKDLDGLAPLLLACAERDVEAAAWLLLPREQGYWPSETTAIEYATRVDKLLTWAESKHVRIPWLAVDLERPLWQAEHLSGSRGLRGVAVQLQLARLNLNRPRFLRAREAYVALARRARASGVRLLCAAHDYVRDELLAGSSLLQDLHEAPVLGVPWNVVSAMLYSSMDPESEVRRRWLYEVAADLRRGLGARAGASIGLTSAGVLGNEPHYTRPDELASDVAALKAAGIEDIAVYSLEGILNSGRPERWLDMLAATTPAVPLPTAASRRRALKHRLLRLALKNLP